MMAALTSHVNRSLTMRMSGPASWTTNGRRCSGSVRRIRSPDKDVRLASTLCHDDVRSPTPAYAQPGRACSRTNTERGLLAGFGAAHQETLLEDGQERRNAL